MVREAAFSVEFAIAAEQIAEVCGPLFATLRRREQRLSAERYVRGLLTADGRKSMRAIAELFGGGAEQQRLQHFISSSSWDWMPVRRALARHLAAEAEPQAWVVRPLVVPKAGNHSVGVERTYLRGAGQMMNIQQAYGAWSASESVSAPVNWRLRLPESWLSDEARRRRARIPDERVDAFGGESACRSVLELDTLETPVVMSVGQVDVPEVLREFRRVGVGVILRVNRSVQVIANDPLVQTPVGARLPVAQLAETVGVLRRPVGWPDAAVAAIRRSCAAAVRVLVPGPDGPRPARLLAEWDRPGPGADRFWLTSLELPPAELLRLTKQVLRVDEDFERLAKPVGIQDFEGRTYQGWHRHMTLASIAHALCALTLATEESHPAELRRVS